MAGQPIDVSYNVREDGTREGKDASTLTPDDIEGVMVLMYSCCISASHADGEEFTMSFEEFCDQLEPAAVNEFYAAIAPDTTGEQKNRARSRRRADGRHRATACTRAGVHRHGVGRLLPVHPC